MSSSVNKSGVLRNGWVAILLLLAPGCAQYEFDLVRPPDLAQHVGSKQDVVAAVAPLQYRMRSVEGNLVIRIYNPTPDSIRLLGAQSVVVDLKGQSHPVRSQVIASNSYIKLILPPPPPEVAPSGPAVGFGIGFGRASPRYGLGYSDAFGDPYYGPRYAGNPDAEPYYWTWTGEGDARIDLAFQRGPDQPFRHVFVFHRRTM